MLQVSKDGVEIIIITIIINSFIQCVSRFSMGSRHSKLLTNSKINSLNKNAKIISKYSWPSSSPMVGPWLSHFLSWRACHIWLLISCKLLPPSKLILNSTLCVCISGEVNMSERSLVVESCHKSKQALSVAKRFRDLRN